MCDTEAPYEKQGYRMDSVHMRGTQDMSTDDVFSYFRHYKPASLEWVSDVSCNLVWLDAVDAARALLGLSRAIAGLSTPRSNKYEEILPGTDDKKDIAEETPDQLMEGDSQDQENQAPEVCSRFRV